MAKKRKASARVEGNDAPPELDMGESRKRIRTYEDVADSDDEFHINQDKVLLEEAPDAKRRRKTQEQDEFLEVSDEEVLDYSEDDELEEAVEEEDGVRRGRIDGVSSGSEDENADGDEEEEVWGTTKEDLYGADEIETEEQALEEEAEALRLQKKQLQAMTAADYGFDESEWQADAAGVDDGGEVLTEVLPQLLVTVGMTSAEKLKLLKSRYPEFEPLSKELVAMQKTQTKLVDAAVSEGEFGRFTPTAVTQLRAASAYLGALTMYFSLMVSPASLGQGATVALAPTRLHEHPVMETLVHCKELWHRAKMLPEERFQTLEVPSTGATNIRTTISDEAAGPERPKAVKKRTKSRAERHAEAARDADDARRAERVHRTEEGLADLDSLISKRRTAQPKVKSATAAGRGDNDVGEEMPLTASEAAEKAKQKKSLRFYTSQIAQKANKRGSAGKNAGGDEDVPHRERLRDRQARLNAEAENRGKRSAGPGAELGGESDEEDDRQAQQIREGGEDDDYYDMVAARSDKKKSDKASLAEAQRQAALVGGEVVQEEVVGADGKRKISYLIEKNKGLTPHRKKDVRNPRVKKRKKYEAKNKKLASMKPVYKGGEGRGGYGGELTGIKKGLVKSTKL